MEGKRVPLSPSRRLAVDFLHFSAGVPSVPVQRRMRLAPVVDARRALAERPCWTAIFLKGLALVAADVRELRRSYLKIPYAHLYEYPASMAAVTIERQIGGEKSVLFAQLRDPAGLGLAELARRLHDVRELPVAGVKSFRRSLRLASWPRPVRRLVMWLGLNLARPRFHYFGTFGVSVYSALGAESLHPLAPLTTLLNYGVIGPDGSVDVRLIYDHRVLDGATVARALVRLEEVLNGPIAEELRAIGAAAGEGDHPRSGLQSPCQKSADGRLRPLLSHTVDLCRAVRASQSEVAGVRSESDCSELAGG
jgi:hypothetical protein